MHNMVPENRCHAAQVHGRHLATVQAMTQRLTPTAALLLVIPPLMWSGNAVVGRLVAP